jgi:hypothetical protein
MLFTICFEKFVYVTLYSKLSGFKSSSWAEKNILRYMITQEIVQAYYIVQLLKPIIDYATKYQISYIIIQ